MDVGDNARHTVELGMQMKLALDGGERTATEAFPRWPSFDDAVLERVLEPLQTGKVNYWTGRAGREFEQSFAEYCGAEFAITTTNGTSALHTALAALGVGAGDEVICPSYTFIATAFSILQAGALPVFADVDQSHTIDPTNIEAQITERTRAILVVHIFGVACDMAPILEIAARHGLFVVEDCAQSLGGSYRGKMLGTIGDAGCFSFCQSKHFTTGGEGGAVVVKDHNLAWLCRSFRDHGYEPEQRLEMFERGSRLNYVHERVGFNYRMTEIQSVIGSVELARFESWNLANRQRNGRFLAERLGGHPAIVSTPVDDSDRTNAYWWAPFVINLDAVRVAVEQLIAALVAEGVPAFNVPWPEIYEQEAFVSRRGFGTRNYPFEDPSARAIDYTRTHCRTARLLGQRTIAFPMHPVYELTHIEQCAKALEKVIAHYAV
jgi:dTDP-4-amino-4,6-dideoxygalactose transaminase